MCDLGFIYTEVSYARQTGRTRGPGLCRPSRVDVLSGVVTSVSPEDRLTEQVSSFL